MTAELLIRVEGHAGRITLNRPQVLNALNQDMVSGMTSALHAWTNDPQVDLVIVDAVGDRAFCAGGDIQLIYHSGRSKPENARRFWYDEYRLNSLIHHCPKPYVAIMNGIVMGGGVGISAHGSNPHCLGAVIGNDAGNEHRLSCRCGRHPTAGRCARRDRGMHLWPYREENERG